MTYTIEQRAGFPTLIGPDTTRQATHAEVELIAERDALAQRCRELEKDRDDCLAARLHYAGLFGKAAGERDTLRAEVELLERIVHYLARIYVVSDDEYDPEAAVERAITRLKETFQ